MEGTEVKVHFPVTRGLFKRQVGAIKAVDGVGIEVREGHTVGVVGESGSGKTTLGMALLRLIKSEGGIRFQGRDIQGLGWKDLRPLRREMQVVFQDPFGSLSPALHRGPDHRGGARHPPARRHPRRAPGQGGQHSGGGGAGACDDGTAIRTSSRAASASASPSPVP